MVKNTVLSPLTVFAIYWATISFLWPQVNLSACTAFFLESDTGGIVLGKNLDWDTGEGLISLNLLHVLSDIDRLMAGLKSIVADMGHLFFTTLVKGNRLSDKYMKAWESAGEVVSRNIDDLKYVFKKSNLTFTYTIDGNMAFIQGCVSPLSSKE